MFNLKIRQFSAEGDKSCICRLSSLDSVCSQKWQVQIMTWILKNRTIHLLPYAIWKRVKIHIWATIHMKALFKIFLLIYNVNSFTSWAEYQLSFNKVFGFFFGPWLYRVFHAKAAFINRWYSASRNENDNLKKVPRRT